MTAPGHWVRSMLSSSAHASLYGCVLIVFLAIAVPCNSATGVPAAGGQGIDRLEFQFVLDPELVTVVHDDRTGYDIVKYDGEIVFSDPRRHGEPMLPAVSRRILLPPGRQVSQLVVVPTDTVVVARNVRPIPIPPPEGSGEPWEEDPYHYDERRVWPPDPSVLADNSAYREFRMADAIALPFEWDSATGTLSMYRSIEITLRLEPASARHSTPQRLRRERRLSSNRSELLFVEQHALNSEDLDRFYPGIRDSSAHDIPDPELPFAYAVTETTHATGFRPTDRPSLQGSPVEMVVITGEEWFDGNNSDDLESAFARFATWRTKTGMPTVIRTVQWIRQNYHGTDDPERIRTFLTEAYSLWGTDFVLLAGDYEVVPSQLWFHVGTELLDPTTDYYYSDFDTEWNNNRDPYIGTPQPLEPIVSFYPELWVGRVPVRDEEEAQFWVEKLLTYERVAGSIPDSSYYTNGLLAAGLLNGSEWGDWNNGLYIAEAVKNDVLDPLGFSSERLYPDLGETAICDGDDEELPCWPSIKDYFGGSYPTGRLNAENMRDQLASGDYSVFFHIEHSLKHQLGSASDDSIKIGSDASECDPVPGCTEPGCDAWEVDCWEQYDANNVMGGMYRELAATISNYPAFFIGMSYGSFTGRFQEDSIAETLVRDPDGGAVAFVCKDVSANDTGDEDFEQVPRTFFLDLLAEQRTCGQSLASALTQKMSEQSSLVWHLLGDPSMVAWTDVPDDLDITIDPDTLLNPDYYEFTATVVTSVGSTPVSNARVCLTRNPDIYATAWTDNSGVARFPSVLVANSLDPISVWTVANNAVPESTMVEEANLTELEDEPSLIYDSHTYDDSGDPGYEADMLEAGDRFDLSIDAKNVSAEEVPAGKAKLGVTPRVRAWMQIDGAQANEDVWIGRSLAHPPAVADTFLLHVNEYGIRPELPPDTLANYGYYVWRDTTFVYELQCHYDPAIYGDTLTGAFSAEGGVYETARTLDPSDSAWTATGDLGDAIHFALVADATDDILSFTAEAEDWVTLHNRWGYYDAVNPNATTTIDSLDVEFDGSMPPRTELDFTLITRYDEIGGSFPVFSDFTLREAGAELEVASFTPRITTFANCAAGLDYVMKIKVRNLGETGLEDAVIRLVDWEGSGVTVCKDTLHIDLPPGAEVQTVNGIHYSDAGANFRVTELHIENSDGDVVERLVGSFSPVPNGADANNIAVIPAPGGLHITWGLKPPATMSTVLGFYVYADTSGTPFRMTKTPLENFSRLWAVDLDRYQTGGDDPIQYDIGVSVVDTNLVEGSIEWYGGVSPVSEEVSLPERPGFPVRMPKGSVGTVAAVNLDGDADLEILAGGRVIAAWDPDGTSANSNSNGLVYDPFNEAGSYDDPFVAFQGELAVDDIDDNDTLEVVGCFIDSVYVVEIGGTLKFSKPVKSMASPIIADLNADGDKEVLVHEHNTGNIYVFEADGTAYGAASSGLYIDPSAVNAFTFSSLAAGVIDGAVRIVQPTTQGTIYVWNPGSGFSSTPTLLTSFVLPGGVKVSTPVIADVNDDGDVDVLVRSTHGSTWSVAAFEGEDADTVLGCCSGTDLFKEDPGLKPLGPPAVSSLGGDSWLELVAGTFDSGSTADRVHVAMGYHTSSGMKVVRGEGKIVLPGRRVEDPSTIGYPILVDWDGDDVLEIIMASNHGALFCWEPVWNASPQTFTLNLEKGWPILHREIQGSPAVADIDGDDFAELIVPTDDGYIHVYNLPGTTIGWGAAGYDVRRSGFVPIGAFSRADSVEAPAVGLKEVLVGENPFQEKTKVSFRSIETGPVEVLIFDARGRRVRTLLKVESMQPGVHEVQWDGRDDLGNPISSGVYFGLVRTGGFELKTRLVKIQ